MTINPWQQKIELGLSDLIEAARASRMEKADGTTCWHLEHGLGKHIWEGFDDGFASGWLTVSRGENRWSERAQAYVRPTLVVRVLNKSAPLGAEPIVRFTPPQETTEILDVQNEPDRGEYGGAWHVADIRDRYAGEGLWRDPDGSSWFVIVLPDEAPYVT